MGLLCEGEGLRLGLLLRGANLQGPGQFEVEDKTSVQVQGKCGGQGLRGGGVIGIVVSESTGGNYTTQRG